MGSDLCFIHKLRWKPVTTVLIFYNISCILDMKARNKDDFSNVSFLYWDIITVAPN